MYCNQCGAQLTPDARVCGACGQPVIAPPALSPPPPPMPPASGTAVGRVTKHRQVAGILWIVYGLVNLPGAMILIGFSGLRSLPGFGYGWQNSFPSFLVPLLSAIGALMLIGALAALVTGVGLLTRQSWARVLAIVTAIISLWHLFGILLGVYTLWVMLPAESELEWNRLAPNV